jgi:hypothetical protein
VVLQIGRVAFGSELRGEKWIDPKPLSIVLKIVCGKTKVICGKEIMEEELVPKH